MEGDNFQFSTEHSGFSIFLADRVKKVHFIRHAEGIHNALSKSTGTNDCLIDNKEMWDAKLTAKGIEQCRQLRKELSQRFHPLPFFIFLFLFFLSSLPLPSFQTKPRKTVHTLRSHRRVASNKDIRDCNTHLRAPTQARRACRTRRALC